MRPVGNRSARTLEKSLLAFGFLVLAHVARCGHDRGGARASDRLRASIHAAPRLAANAPTKAVAKRHRGDSNPCGQRPMDFESISLAARTQCHVMDHFLIGLIKQSLKCSGLLGSANCKPLAALSLNFVLSLAEPTCRRDATFRKSAASEDRTHDLRIMRPTRCQLRYRRQCKHVAK